MKLSLSGARTKRLIAVSLAATLALVGVVMLRGQQSVSADTRNTQVTYTCPIVGGLAITETATDTPDPATAGGNMNLTFSGGVPTVPITVTLNNVVLVVPIPSGVTVNNVTFSGGNVPGSAAIGANEVTLTFAGPVQSTAIQLPAASFDVSLAASTAGTTVTWEAPSRISTDVVGIGVQACDRAAGQPPMQETAVNAAPTTTTTTTTAPTTTTTRATTTTAPTTTTTAPTTTTTRATTTTAPTTTTTAPTTTTTAPTTTTTRGTTTTTRGTTTTTRVSSTTTRVTSTTTRPVTTTTQGGGGGLLELIRKLLCLIFRIC